LNIIIGGKNKNMMREKCSHLKTYVKLTNPKKTSSPKNKLKKKGKEQTPKTILKNYSYGKVEDE
tara:strand:+ start:367 stop:558 length:192 start_codon:yes stop_codon:yes gene_type:complete